MLPASEGNMFAFSGTGNIHLLPTLGVTDKWHWCRRSCLTRELCAEGFPTFKIG